jgi:DNA polymerase III sliding clamp (beta) subunit (PCNA family)
VTRVNRELLIRQLESVQPGLSPREIVEQSSCFVFKDGRVVTYNDEVACSNTCCLDAVGAVQAEPLLAILQKLPEEEIEVTTEDGELRIRGKSRRAGLHMEAEITLPVDSIEVPADWKTLCDGFAEAISIVQTCAGKDESKFCLTCVHITPKYIEACDNYQVSRYRMKTRFTEDALVRRNSIKHIVSLGFTEFCETKNWLHFRSGEGLVLSCRRFLEDFPDISGMLAGSGTPISLPKGLADAADAANVFSSEGAEDDDQVAITLSPGKVRVKGVGVTGWYSETKKVQYDGEELQFLISPKLLIQLVREHSECEVGSNRLRVTGDRFVYVSCLGVVKDS